MNPRQQRNNSKRARCFEKSAGSHLVVLRGQLLYGVHKGRDIVGVNARRNPVTEIKHMATTVAKSGEDTADFLAYSPR